MNKLQDFFWNKDKKCLIHKWVHYLDIYDKHFKRFIGNSPTILEVGVSRGGSLEMWNDYFDGQCEIFGVDIDPDCLKIPEKLNAKNIHVDIGDQSNRKFWKDYLQDKPRFDIVIEDGGHMMNQQIVTFEEVYNHVNENGVYLCEDLHTSYWGEYGGGYKKDGTFMEYIKNFIDGINSQHIREQIPAVEELKYIRETAKSIHYYDSVVVLEKGRSLPASATERHPTV